MDILTELEKRELLYQVTDREGLAKRLEAGPVTLYIGFDPTADSLHIGNLLQILLLRRFQLAGHHPIGLVGGGTGLIGDPSGRSSERQLNAQEVVELWTEKIRGQVEKLLDFESPSNPARIVSNYDWLSKLEIIPFLRDYGKHFTINSMLAKDSVKTRLEEGISFTEFSYMVMQAYDFLRLKKDLGVELQAGGSDQWGNITAGVDLVRRAQGETVYGLTQPLITRSDGAKLGKTAEGTIWLDETHTTPYEFYQYFINIPDGDAIKFLKYFTLLPLDEIEDLAIAFNQDRASRSAQKRLAEEVTTLVHGREAMISAQNISQALFYGRVSALSQRELEQGLFDVPSFDLNDRSEINLIDLLAEAGISPSKRRAREDVQNGAIRINDKRCRDIGRMLNLDDRLADKYIVIRRGKNKYHLVRWTN